MVRALAERELIRGSRPRTANNANLGLRQIAFPLNVIASGLHAKLEKANASMYVAGHGEVVPPRRYCPPVAVRARGYFAVYAAPPRARLKTNRCYTAGRFRPGVERPWALTPEAPTPAWPRSAHAVQDRPGSVGLGGTGAVMGGSEMETHF